MEAATSLTDLSKCYFSLSGIGSCTLAIDLVAVHDGTVPSPGGHKRGNLYRHERPAVLRPLLSLHETGIYRLGR